MAGAGSDAPAEPFDPGGALLSVPIAAGSAHRPPQRGGSMSLASGPASRYGNAGHDLPPLALFERTGNADRIAAVCEAAEAMGLRPGTGLSEARARFPGLDLVPADPAADARLLEAVADWCDRYTPLVALDGLNGLVLDISGCTHLFGGEEALMDDLQGRLLGQGFCVAAAVASRAGTASALVGFAPAALVPQGGEAAAVETLPLAALRLDPVLAAALRRLGLKRLGDLVKLPRAGLVRRFGPDLARRLDEATGAARRPIGPRRPVPLIIHERRLFEPVSLTEDILRLGDHLARRLCEDLERRGQGARSMELALFRVDGRVERLEVRTGAPLRDPARIGRLFTERLKASGEELDAGYGYDLVRLSVLTAEAMAARQADLAEDPAGTAQDLGELLDRLGTRLGESCVFALEGVASHRPERAQRRHSAGGGAKGWFTMPSSLLVRPLRLLERPEGVEATAEVPDGPIRQFRWRRAHYRIRRIEGPERIAPEWWRDKDETLDRDYFRVEDEEGRRYWLFRQAYSPSPASGWFLHGLFA